jgi:uncharacterized membrane protein
MGSKSGGSAPAAPDPRVTSQAQTDSNAATARLQAQLNRVNQVGPTGRVTWSQGAPAMDRQAWEDGEVARARAAFDATNPGPDSSYVPMQGGGDNDANNTPGSALPRVFDEAGFRASLAGRPVPTMGGQDQWTMTTTLSPEQQRLYDLSTRAQTTYGNIGNTLLDNVRGQLSQPVNVDWAAERDRALQAQLGRLNPTMASAEENLRQRLRNSGLTEGSEGWNREFRNFNQGRNDMLLGADLNAGNTVGQAIQQQAALRGMPLNEVAALLSGQQVQTPQLANTPQVGVAPTDVMGAYNTAYQGQLAQWQNRQQQQAAGLGGLFGLAGTLGGAAIRSGLISDARLKDHIRRIGTADNGLPIYSFTYKGDTTTHIGLMAQDVAPVNPDAVMTMPNGFMAVDYGKALEA